MKISYNWLKEYIDLKEPPEKIADMLTKSGSEVKSIDAIEGGGHVMEIEITPNRSDCLNYIGIAREVSALTGKKIKMPLLKIKTKNEKRKTKDAAPFTVEIKDKDICPRYTARLIKNVIVKESPEWLKKKIVSMGLRPVNNVVDITNFVLFEIGQPMHAFDYDKIKGQKVVIRRAAEGERIASIDNVERKLEKEMLVIADEEKPIAIAGVMGSVNTEVNFSTQNILLESAYFNPVSIRRTSYKLALISESGFRFERSVDLGMVLPASCRAALLIQELCGGEIGELVDKGEKPSKDLLRTVDVRIDRLNKILNIEFTEPYIKKVLAGLSLCAASQRKGVLKVTIPSFRQDIKDEIDIVEEVARIYGYENIASTIPHIAPNPERRPLPWQIKEKTAETLVSLGLSEVVTYGLTSRASLHKTFGCEIPAIAVKNYMSVEQEIMRPSLIPGVLAVLSRNINRGIKDLKIFEIGAAYSKSYYSKDCHYENTHLCIALTGLLADDWQRPKSQLTLFDLKGIIYALFLKLGLSTDKIEITAERIFYDKKHMGCLTVPDKKTLDMFDLADKVFIAEINLDDLTRYVDLRKKFKDMLKYPSIKRDISLIAEKDITWEKIAGVVKEQGKNLIENIELFDSDNDGRQIPGRPPGALAFRIEYRDRTRTLTSEEVDKVHSAIRASLVKKLGVALREIAMGVRPPTGS